MLTWWYNYTTFFFFLSASTVNNKTSALIADTCSTPRRRIQCFHAGSSASRCVFLRAARKNCYLLTISAVCFSTSPWSSTVRLCSASSAVFICRPAKHQLCFLHVNSPSRKSGILDICFPPKRVNKHIGVVLIVDTCSWWVHMLVT